MSVKLSVHAVRKKAGTSTAAARTKIVDLRSIMGPFG
jgi:hypothetical protein